MGGGGGGGGWEAEGGNTTYNRMGTIWILGWTTGILDPLSLHHTSLATLWHLIPHTKNLGGPSGCILSQIHTIVVMSVRFQ